jgi:chemosensory pili system protein ChpA (sensor histidine kinase/response regulator)
MQSRLALAKEDKAGFDLLEFDRFTCVQELTCMEAESVNDVATVQRTLQRTIEATEDDPRRPSTSPGITHCNAICCEPG